MSEESEENPRPLSGFYISSNEPPGGWSPVNSSDYSPPSVVQRATARLKKKMVGKGDKSDMLVYYKVVRAIDGKYFSAVASRPDKPWMHDASMEFVPGEKATPDFGQIFVFDSRHKARNFVTFDLLDDIENLEIWEAHKQDYLHTHNYSLDPCNPETTLDNMRLFWRGHDDSKIVHLMQKREASSVPSLTLATRYLGKRDLELLAKDAKRRQWPTS